MKSLLPLAFTLLLSFTLPTAAQVATNPPSSTGRGRIQNIVPEEMWKRVTQCMFPAYPELAFDSRIAGTVDIGLGISPEGDVTDTSRVLDGPPLLVPSAVDAIRQWKFRPNMVQGELTWSRVRALVRFNADGTTAVDLAPAILADNFGDPGTPSSAAAFPRLRPASSPECKSVLISQPDVASALSGVYRVGGGVLAPRVIYAPNPEYAEAARKAKEQGTVVLWLVVTPEGSVRDVKVARSLSTALDKTAIEAVQSWKFEPAKKDGQPVAVQINVEVKFKLH